MADLSKLSNEELLKLAKSTPPPSTGGSDLSKLSDKELLQLASDSKPRPKTTKFESALVGTSQGLTAGFSDEGIGALRGAIGKLRGEGDFGKLYEKYRDEQRNYQKNAQADNPDYYLGGSVLGTLVGPGKFAKAASTAGKIGMAALGGGVTAAGLSENDPTKSPRDLENFAGDVATGATVGGVSQGVFSALGKTVNALRPTSLRKTAEEAAFKAAGGMTKEFRDAQKAGTMHSTGRQLLDKKIVTAFSSLEDVAERAGKVKGAAGKAIGDALGNVDDLVADSKKLVDSGKLLSGASDKVKQEFKKQLDETYQFNMSRIGERIRKEVIKPNADNPLLKAEMAKLASVADDFVNSSSKTLEAGNIIKGTQGKVTKFESDTMPNAFKKEVYDIIKTELDDIVAKTGTLESALSKAGGNALGELGDIAARNKAASSAYASAKKTYAAMKSTQDMANKRLGQAQSNRGISLTDTIAGVGGFASGGPVQGLALGAANKFIRKYGSSLKAVGSDKLADILEKSPQALGRFADPLEKAAKNGGPALVAAHMALMKDPEYRRTIGYQENNAIKRRLGGQ